VRGSRSILETFYEGEARSASEFGLPLHIVLR